MTSLTASSAVTTAPQRSRRPAALVLFALLVTSQVAIVVFSLWEPPFDGTIRFDEIAPISGAYWPMNVLLGGPGYALGTIAASVFLAVLGAGRGNTLALVSTTLHLLAGVVFALVITAEVLPFAWATGPSIVSEAQGRALFEAYNGNFDAFLPYILGSMAGVALGALMAVTGAAISGGLSWWVPAVTVALIVALFALPLGNPLGDALGYGQRALWIFIGRRGLRALVDRG